MFIKLIKKLFYITISFKKINILPHNQFLDKQT